MSRNAENVRKMRNQILDKMESIGYNIACHCVKKSVFQA